MTELYEEYDWSALEVPQTCIRRLYGEGARRIRAKREIKHPNTTIKKQRNMHNGAVLMLFGWIVLLLGLIASYSACPDVSDLIAYVFMSGYIIYPTGLVVMFRYQDDPETVSAQERLIKDGILPPLRSEEESE